MIQQRTPGPNVRRLFLTLAIAALAAAFVQVTLGGVVRVTDSGLGCPDWPLCHGRLVPPFDVATLIEYTHRLSASALAVLSLGTAIVAWRYYRSAGWVVAPSVLALALVVVAAVLGGVTVLTELASWVVSVHLGIAEIVVAALVVATVAGWRLRDESRPSAGETSKTVPGRLYLWAAVGTFLVILSGSYMVGFGAGSSCATWPLCRGSLMPEGTAYAVHMGHRFLVALIGALVLWAAASAWRRRSDDRSLGRFGAAVGTLFVVQILGGAALAEGGFSPALKALHLSLATLVWTALVYLPALAYVPRGLEAFGDELGSSPQPETGRVPL